MTKGGVDIVERVAIEEVVALFATRADQTLVEIQPSTGKDKAFGS